MTLPTHCGVVAIIGEPNAGKSTLVNRLVGGKVSIVSPKVQTTRFNVRGVCVHEQSQLIFIDTPGIFSAEKQFEKAMVSAAWAGMGDADAVILLLDAHLGLKDSTRTLLEKITPSPLAGLSANERSGRNGGAESSTSNASTPHPNLPPQGGKEKPICLALNKVDAVKKEKLFELADACNKLGVFDRIFMISALNGDGVDDVKSWLATKMPEGPFLYPEDQMSDISLRLLAAEITREKIFMALEQELPYAIFVETESWDEQEDNVKIAQIILVQREGQKKIVIGDKGSMIKKIGMSSRLELANIVGKKIHLTLFVKVKPNWKEDSESYRTLGLEFKK